MHFKIGLAALLFATAALAQSPAIRGGGVVNAASLTPAGAPNSGIAQGAQFAILGTNLGPTEAVQASGYPYPSTDGLGGVTMKVTVGGTSADAILVSVSEKKIVAVLPSTVATGTGTVSLTYNGASATAPIEVVNSNVGIFARSQTGGGPAMARNRVDDGSATDNSIAAPAKPGQQLALLGTGLGAVQGDEAGGPISGSAGPDVDVMVGGKRANVISKGRAETAPGVDQIVIEVPAEANGCAVAVAVRTGTRVSNFTTIAVSQTETCVDANGYTPAELEKFRLQTEFSQGSISLSRSSFSLMGFEQTTESATGSFSKYKIDGTLTATFFAGQPSVGSCIVNILPIVEDSVTIDIQNLDAGPSLTLTGPKGTRQMEKRDGAYIVPFEPSLPIPGLPVAQAFLDPGEYTVTGPGGADVGAFTARLTLGAALNWTNRATVGNAGNDTVDRGSDITVRWTGGSGSDLVTITGVSTTARVSAYFTCLERADIGNFTVPAWVLSAIPPATQGFLSLSLSPTGNNRFEASGIDSGFVSATSSSARLIAYR